MPVIFNVKNERHHLSYEIAMQAAFDSWPSIIVSDQSK